MASVFLVDDPDPERRRRTAKEGARLFSQRDGKSPGTFERAGVTVLWGGGDHVPVDHYVDATRDTLLLGDPEPSCVRATILPDGSVATLPGRKGKMLMAAIVTPALLFATAGAATSPRTGAIVGSVSTAGTAVRVTVEAPGLRRSAAIDDQGAYRFDGLPPGEYRLVFSSAPSRRWTIARVAVRANHVTVRNSYDPALPVFVTAGVPVPLPPPPAPEAQAGS